MKQFNTALALLIFLSISVTACKSTDGLTGAGPVMTKTIPLTQSFDEISVSEGWQVILIKSDQPHMQLITQQNIIPAFTYQVKKGHLSISSKLPIASAELRKVKVYYTSLKSIEATTGSIIQSKERLAQRKIELASRTGAQVTLSLATKHCQAELDTDGTITLTGTSKNIATEAETGAVLNAQSLQAEDGEFEAATGAVLNVNVTGDLEAEAKTGGKVIYYGHPKNIDLAQDDSGRVIPYS